jgi:photoactive yellow protein
VPIDRTPPTARTAPTADAVYDADGLSSAELDALPYGMVQLDSTGRVLRYSSEESRLSGRAAAECVGRDFFHDVAPCTRVAEFYGRFRDGVSARQLDAVFTFRFAFTPPKEVRIHMFYSAVTRSVWVKVVDLEATAAGGAEWTGL